MSETIKEDGTLAELSEESLAILQVGDREVVAEAESGDTEVLEAASDASDAGTAEAVQDADATGGDGGGKDASRWYGDGDVELARSYGLGEAELEEFGSAEEFRRAALFFDRRLRLDLAGEKPGAAADGETKSAEAEEEAEVDVSAFSKENGYDDDTIRLAQSLAKTAAKQREIEQRLAEMQARAAADAERQRIDEHKRFVDGFHQAVDALGDELFGDSQKDAKVRLGAQDSEAAQRRLRLFEAIRTYGGALGDVSLATKVKRARDIEFGDVIRERDKRQLLEGIAQQSKRRRTVSSVRRQARTVPAKDRRPDGPNDVEYILGDQEFQDRWRKITEG